MPSFVLAAINLSPTLITSVVTFSVLVIYFFCVYKTMENTVDVAYRLNPAVDGAVAGTAHSEQILERWPSNIVAGFSHVPVKES